MADDAGPRAADGAKRPTADGAKRLTAPRPGAAVADDAGPRVTESRITVRGRVPGIDEAGFQEAVQAADLGCPVSNALRGNVDLSVDASLEA